jgi:hypothetical protein
MEIRNEAQRERHIPTGAMEYQDPERYNTSDLSTENIRQGSCTNMLLGSPVPGSVLDLKTRRPSVILTCFISDTQRRKLLSSSWSS